MRVQASMEIMVGAVIVMLFALYSATVAIGLNTSAYASEKAISAGQNASFASSNLLAWSCGCLLRT